MSASSVAFRFEGFACRPLPVANLVDSFAQVRATQGPFPPPFGRLAFTITEKQTPAGPVSIDPPQPLAALGNPSGFYLLSNEVTTQRANHLTIAPGSYNVHIDSDYYQPADLLVTWPPDPAQVPAFNLLPGAAYPFPDLTVQQGGAGLTLVRGSLFQSDGTPIAGVGVGITAPAAANNWPFRRCLTSATGDWAVVIPDRQSFIPPGPNPPPTTQNITLHIELPAGAVDLPNIKVNMGAENSVPQTSMRGRVVSDKGIAIPEAAITVNGVAGSSRSRSDGQWLFYFDFQQNDAQIKVTATAPNGRSQDQMVNVRKLAAVVVPAFQIPMN
jgi:hypothetical protein